MTGPQEKTLRYLRPKQLRIKTNDKLVYLGFIDGEDVSMRWYGPFESADEQRQFMLCYINDAPIDEALKAKYREMISAWVRFDEEPGYEPPPAPKEPEP